MRYMKPWSLFQDLPKSNALKKGRFLCLDVGVKYVGLSVADHDNEIASPLSVLCRTKSNIDLMATDFQSLAAQVKDFVDDLCKTGKFEGFRYTYWDEKVTSKNVELFLEPIKVHVHPVESKTIKDKLAAVGILQGYLDYVNGHRVNNEEDHAGKRLGVAPTIPAARQLVNRRKASIPTHRRKPQCLV